MKRGSGPAALDKRLDPLRNNPALARPGKGWIRAIRDALGLTAAQLARKMGVSQQAVTKLEKSEVEDAASLKTLRSAAEALDCALVYAFVPRKPIESMLRERAAALADRQLARTHHTMQLENQAVSSAELKEERQRLIEALMRGDPRMLWQSFETDSPN